MLSRFSIRAKLITLVSVLLLALVGMGAFAIIEMRIINASAQDIRANWLPGIRLLSELRTQSARYRAILRDHILITDEKGKASVDKNLDERVKAFNLAATKYEPLISTPEEQTLFDEMKQLWQQYLYAANDVIGASRRGEYAQAVDISTNKATPPGRAMDSVLAKIVDLNDKGADLSGEKADRNYALALRVLLGTLVLMILIGLCAAFLIVRDIARGIRSAVAPMQALANGDLSVEISHRDEKNEIGQITKTLEIFKSALIAKKNADETAAQESEAQMRRAETMDDATRNFEAMIGELIGSLSSASNEMEATAGTLTNTADFNQELSNSAASASQEVSASIQSTATATEEITSSVNEISRQVQESSRVAQLAVEQAEKTDTSIGELSQAAARIGDVVKLITAIAEQTNLLALNATIEAARAGEAGRGFAVVASEVKALAAQTAKATDEIGTQISGMQTATSASVATIKEISSTINLISEISATIAAAVEEQGAATQEIARNVQQTAGLSAHVANNIADVNRGNSETGAASAQVLAAAKSLSKESNHLQVEVQNFLTTIRAA